MAFASKTRHDPLISIVMPVYNGERYLVDSLASLLTQTLTDWELICVNDGSTDHTPALLDWFCSQDSRIRVVHQHNQGLVPALNAGCAEVTAPLLCRMDCDDIAFPDRLEKQAQFMRRNPTCVVVGGSVLEIDEDGEPLNVACLPQGHTEIVDNLLHRRTGHFHPSTMIRSEAMEAVGGYRQQYEWVEDHDLWLRLAQRGTLANLPDVVLCYRQHASSVCWRHSGQQRERVNQLLREAYAARGREAPSEVLLTHTPPRSPAGPGKWARLAARGGYPRSVAKHLGQLLRSDARWSYKTRMCLEATLRLTVSSMRHWLQQQPVPQKPVFPQWQQRVAQQFTPAEHGPANHAQQAA
ncbi:MAG: glycosyltransferase [Planctomycetales bacterium]|nr:glycosyltransferase [Planctomycetales bacterium]